MGNTQSSRYPKPVGGLLRKRNRLEPSYEQKPYNPQLSEKDSGCCSSNICSVEQLPPLGSDKRRPSLPALRPPRPSRPSFISMPSFTRTATSFSSQTSSPPPTPGLPPNDRDRDRDDAHFSWLQERRFLAGERSGMNILPNDDEEIDRTVMLHFLLKCAFSGNFVAPVGPLLDPPAYATRRPRVLDVGCGSGAWVLEMATDYPDAECHGVDISPIFPNYIKPPNAYFHLCNVLDGLPFEDATFDFVHMRLMWMSFARDQWDSIARELKRILRPGGWIEIMDPHIKVHKPGPMTDMLMNHQLPLALHSRNIHPFPSPRYAALLSATLDLRDVHQRRLSLPYGWGGELGRMNLQDMVAVMRGFKPWLCHDLGLTCEEYDERIARVSEECVDRTSFSNCYVAYGRKPEEGEEGGRASRKREEEEARALWESWQPLVDGFVE